MRLSVLALLPLVSAYSWMANSKRAHANPTLEKRHPSWHPALQARSGVSVTSQYPYVGAKNGLPGTGIGNIQVPAPGDTAHRFIAPSSSDIRGPCPGQNLAANYGFISRDGRTNYAELVDAAQNVWNLGWDLSTVLGVLEFTLSGNLLSDKITIGRPDLLYTNGRPASFSRHGGFEQDTSMTRADLGITGDALSFNGSQYSKMYQLCTTSESGLFDLECGTKSRRAYYEYSIANNPTFFYGPLQLILHGAATFLYTIFPSGGRESGNLPDATLVGTIFGAVRQNDGSFAYAPESLPAGWRNKKVAYGLVEVVVEINKMYLADPLIFGGNQGKVDTFTPLNIKGLITNGTINANFQGVDGFMCFIYQAIVQEAPKSVIDPILGLTTSILDGLLGKLNPIFSKYNCL